LVVFSLQSVIAVVALRVMDLLNNDLELVHVGSIYLFSFGKNLFIDLNKFDPF